MDPVKVIIFVGAFLLLLLLGRKLSAASEIRPTAPPEPVPLQPATNNVKKENEVLAPSPVVGADLPFPVRLPELEMDDDGKFNRPEFLNYHFATIDLLQGPSNPKSFFDEFFVETRNPEDQHIGTYKYLVATPAGLQRAMDEERLPVMYLENQVIIVAQWDLTLILNAAVQEIIKTYRGWQAYAEEHALPDTDGQN
ncbi:MAG: hypothetical protein LAO78_15770 [Acidobacteriia bacterium]|nr:hypothetical protein [Terriglobia bacterium]